MKRHRRYSIIAFGIFCCLSVIDLYAQNSENTANLTDKNPKAMSLKNAFKNMSVENRIEAIQNAIVMKDSPLQNSQADFNLTSHLQKICGSSFNYQKSAKGYQWPEVRCRYKADDGGFGGATPKFQCEFEDKSKTDGWDKRKVKYPSLFKSYDSQETVPTFLAATIAHLLGFYTEIYCPARIICESCPSDDPWSLDRATATPQTGYAVFKRALVEVPVKAFNIRNPAPEQKYSQGFDFNEIDHLSSEPERRRQQIIEREAWLLWISFIAEMDAYHFNQRLACLSGEWSVEQKPICHQSVLYTHDYGHAFYEKMQLKKWAAHPVIRQLKDNQCQGGLSSEDFKVARKRDYQNRVLSPIISREARDLLLSRLELISDDLWLEIFEIARAHEVSSHRNPVNAQMWLQTIKDKIATLKQTQCGSVDERLSAVSTQ